MAGLLALFGILLLLGGWWAGWQAARGPDVPAESDVAEAPLATGDAEQENRPSIAVLPFADMSPTGDREYFSDGMTEEISNTLAKIRTACRAVGSSARSRRGDFAATSILTTAELEGRRGRRGRPAPRNAALHALQPHEGARHHVRSIKA